MSSNLDKLLGRGAPLNAEPSSKRAMIDSGGRPQMGFMIQQADGTIDGFLYHNLDNIRCQERNGKAFLSFTHRGTAVTIQGSNLKIIMRAIMRHTLVELHHRPGFAPSADEPDQPIIEVLAITPPELPPGSVRLAKG